MPKIYKPEDFAKFPFDLSVEKELKRNSWHLMRASEFHQGNIFGCRNDNFIIMGIEAEGTDEDVVYVLPPAMSMFLDFAVERGIKENKRHVAKTLKALIAG